MSRRAKHRKLDSSDEVLELSDSEAANSRQRIKTPTPRRTALSRSTPEPIDTFSTPPHSSLSKYAFQAPPPRTKSRSGPITNVQKLLPQGGELTRASILRNQKRARLSAIGASETAISRLGRCVCCEERWKVKKTFREKLSHIEECAKQHACAPETVSILIKKELTKAANPGTDTSVSQKTHLENVVQDALPKRKGRSKESTLQEFGSQTRADVTKRLRALLGPPVRLDAQERDFFPASTQALRSSPSHRSLNISTGVQFPCPPSSSPVMHFLPSRLLQAQRHVDHQSSSGPPIPKRLFHSSSTNRIKARLAMLDTPLETYHGSFLVKDLVRGIKGISPLSPSTSPSAKTQRKRRGKSISPVIPHTQTARRRKKRRSQILRVTRGERRWQQEFLTKIMQDVGLYHRILRCEPIHFDVFRRLAPPPTFPGVFRRQIIEFLDQHAINYLGYSTIGRLYRRRTPSKKSALRAPQPLGTP